jgi:predicted DNA-binding WGR domain protein
VSTEETYLERIDRTQNMARYYRLSVVETLFGEWAMVREWGRIGRHGQSREHWCSSKVDAVNQLRSRHDERLRRGYRQVAC